jgi:hypothetical protein
MGILDNFAKRVADQITKASPDVAPIPEWQMQQQRSYGNTVALPRDPNLANVPFTPGLPLVPGSINPVRPDGRPDPRRYEYQVAQNINITETRLVPFKTLRAAAEQIDILRRCVEVMKQKMVGLKWDIVLGEDAVEKVMADTGEKNRIRAMSVAKDKFGAEISRAKQFWEVPDLSNGLIFSDWLNMALEDILVLDAWAVWPQKTVGGDLRGLQVLDGATIKPLIDDRGMRPLPPQPAFQQILYGFPRSEFAAPSEGEDVDGEFTSDELQYMIRNRRTTTIYGLSPVERALPLADIYLRRQQWIRAEYTDGVLPELMFKTDANFGNNPDLLRAYENILNDDLSGQTEQRKRARLLPAGLDPVQMDGYGEKFKDVLDEFLVTSICGHFGVLPSEIGFTPAAGLGGSGHQAGEATSSEVIGLIPLSQWVGRMLSQMSYVWLGMPRELEFRFMPSDRNDSQALAQTLDNKVRGGRMTLNEARAEEGLPLIDSPLADQPLFVAGGLFTLTDDGLIPISAGGIDTNNSGEASTAVPADSQQELPDESPADKPAEQKFAILKFNENHGEGGRFTSADDSGSNASPNDLREASHEAVQSAITNIQSASLADANASGHYANQFREAQASASEAQRHLNDAISAHESSQHDVASAHMETAAQLVSDAASSMIQATGGGSNALRSAVGMADQARQNYAAASRLDSNKAAIQESKAFIRWLRKSPTRPFTFTSMPSTYAETLNKFVALGDFDGARWFAERYIS